LERRRLVLAAVCATPNLSAADLHLRMQQNGMDISIKRLRALCSELIATGHLDKHTVPVRARTSSYVPGPRIQEPIQLGRPNSPTASRESVMASSRPRISYGRVASIFLMGQAMAGTFVGENPEGPMFEETQS
jgi:hypothetical protein